MKLSDILAYAKAGYTPKDVKQIQEYTDTVDKPEDILAFAKAGWKPDDIKSLITEQKPDKDKDKPNKNKTPKSPLEELKEFLTQEDNDNA